MPIVTNAHTHLELTDMSCLYPDKPEPLNVWMKKVITHVNKQTYEKVNTAIQRGIDILKENGTTHICDVTATWQSVKLLQKSGLQGIVFLEVRGRIKKTALKQLERAKEFIALSQKQNKSPITLGLSLHAPYSCHADLLKNGAVWSKKNNIPLCLHVAESPVEYKWIKYSRVATYTEQNRFLKKAGGLLSTFIPAVKPVCYLESLGVLSAMPYMIHCVNICDEEIKLIADRGCTVIHCPRSNEILLSGRMKLEKLISANINVLLGTDSLASSPDLNIQNEAEFAKKLHRGFVDEALISAMINKSVFKVRFNI